EVRSRLERAVATHRPPDRYQDPAPIPGQVAGTKSVRRSIWQRDGRCRHLRQRQPHHHGMDSRDGAFSALLLQALLSPRLFPVGLVGAYLFIEPERLAVKVSPEGREDDAGHVVRVMDAQAVEVVPKAGSPPEPPLVAH